MERLKGRLSLRLLCFGFSMFIIFVYLATFYHFRFRQGSVIFGFAEKDTNKGFYIERGQKGLELWETSGLMELKRFP